ncbi:MAG: response regulator transcription factor [Nocardioidaceae bacterium]
MGSAIQRVVIVEDHLVFAELLELALQLEHDLECVGHAQTIADGVVAVDSLRPDIVIMDVQLGDGDGIAAAAEMTARHLDLRVIILTAFVEPRLLQRAAAANACALLPKDGDLNGMLNALRTAKRGGFTVRPELLRRLVSHDEPAHQRPPSLTRREQEVLQMLAAGLEARLIAREMGISVNTCRGYVKSLLAKLGAHSQLEAVAVAMRHGLIHVHALT